MLTISFYRIAFFILSMLAGTALAHSLGLAYAFAVPIAFIFSFFLLLIEYFLTKLRARDVIAFMVGLSVALVTSNVTAFLVTLIPYFHPAKLWVYLLANITGIYFFGGYAYYRRNELKFLEYFLTSGEGESPHTRKKILDTSAIIDGRIVGIAKTGFLEGEIIVPKFILRELQRIADSKDHVKRTKGRRGLDVLKELQHIPDLKVEISAEDIPKTREVDQKLIELAKKSDAVIITTDYNLKKLSDIHNIRVLNVNELSKELKPTLVPGDTIEIKIIKPGKEETQGVGYLEDGTMVVMENGKSFLGKEVNAVIISFLQTDSGRIIFARPREFGASGRSVHKN